MATASVLYLPESQPGASASNTSRSVADQSEKTFADPGKTDWTRVDAMTDEEVIAAAEADPDNPPWSDEKLARARRVAFVKPLRFKLSLGRATFASRYHIDETLIAAWEHHQSEADAMAMAHLRVIAADPDGVAKTLTASGIPAQAAE